MKTFKCCDKREKTLRKITTVEFENTAFKNTKKLLKYLRSKQ